MVRATFWAAAVDGVGGRAGGGGGGSGDDVVGCVVVEASSGAGGNGGVVSDVRDALEGLVGDLTVQVVRGGWDREGEGGV